MCYYISSSASAGLVLSRVTLLSVHVTQESPKARDPMETLGQPGGQESFPEERLLGWAPTAASWCVGAEGLPGQAGVGAGCVPGSRRSPLAPGAASARAGPRLPAWLSAAPCDGRGSWPGLEACGRDTSEGLHGGGAGQAPRGPAS